MFVSKKLKDEPNQDLSYAYITADGSFASMPDELYILLVSEREDEVYAHECPFNTILVTGTSNNLFQSLCSFFQLFHSVSPFQFQFLISLNIYDISGLALKKEYELELEFIRC